MWGQVCYSTGTTTSKITGLLYKKYFHFSTNLWAKILGKIKTFSFIMNKNKLFNGQLYGSVGLLDYWYSQTTDHWIWIELGRSGLSRWRVGSYLQCLKGTRKRKCFVLISPTTPNGSVWANRGITFYYSVIKGQIVSINCFKWNSFSSFKSAFISHLNIRQKESFM